LALASKGQSVYIPKHFEELRVEVMHDLICASPLATLVTHCSNGLNANHIPFNLVKSPEPYGMLQGHIARANPLFREITDGVDTLAIFHGPDSYITPSWYPTKKETEKVVPTWNYAVVHVYGVLRTVGDASWLRAQLAALTDHNEAAFSDPWSVSDAPNEHVENLMAAIVGVEILITKMLGKWKVSQNQPAQNQAGVISGLKVKNDPSSKVMVELVEAGAKNAR
jgi:transcriptional regulator